MRPALTFISLSLLTLVALAPRAASAGQLQLSLSCPIGHNPPSAPRNPDTLDLTTLAAQSAPGDGVLPDGDVTFTCQIFVGNQTGLALRGLTIALALPTTQLALHDPARLDAGSWRPDGAWSAAPLMLPWSVSAIPAGFISGAWDAAQQRYVWTLDLDAANATAELRVQLRAPRRALLGQPETITLTASGAGQQTTPQRFILQATPRDWPSAAPDLLLISSTAIDPDNGWMSLGVRARPAPGAWGPLQPDARLRVFLPYAARDPLTDTWEARADGAFDPLDPDHRALIDLDALRGELALYTFGPARPHSMRFGADGRSSWPASGMDADRIARLDRAAMTLDVEAPGMWWDQPDKLGGRGSALVFGAPLLALPPGLDHLDAQVCYASTPLALLAATPWRCQTRRWALAPDAAPPLALRMEASTLSGFSENAPLPITGSDATTLTIEPPGLLSASAPVAGLDLYTQLPGDDARRARFTWAAVDLAYVDTSAVSIYVSTTSADYSSGPDISARQVPTTPDGQWVRCGAARCDASALRALGIDPDRVEEVRFSFDAISPAGLHPPHLLGGSPSVRVGWDVRGARSSIDGVTPPSRQSIDGASLGANYSWRVRRANAPPLIMAPGPLDRHWIEVGAAPRRLYIQYASGHDRYTPGQGSAPITLFERVAFSCGLGDYSEGAEPAARLPMTIQMIIPEGFDPLVTDGSMRPDVTPFLQNISSDLATRYHDPSTRQRDAFDPGMWSARWDPARRMITVQIDALPGGQTLLTPRQVVGVEVRGVALPGAPRSISIASPTDPARACDITALVDRQGDGVWSEEVYSPDPIALPVTSVAPALNFAGARPEPTHIKTKGQLTQIIEVDNHAWRADGTLDTPSASASARDAALFIRVPRAGDWPAVERDAAGAALVAVRPGDARVIWISEEEAPLRAQASAALRVEGGWRRCALSPAPCDEAAMRAVGLEPGAVRWVALDMGELLVTDAAPRGQAPRQGRARINIPYTARLVLRDLGSPEYAILRAVAELHTQDTAASSSLEPTLDVIIYERCDPREPGFGPDHPEICDGRDNDCDGEIDEGLICQEPPEPDIDGDGVPDTRDNCPAVYNPAQDDACASYTWDGRARGNGAICGVAPPAGRVGSGAWLWLAALGLIGWRRRGAWIAALVVALGASAAQAQEAPAGALRVQQYQPLPGGDVHFTHVSGGRVRGHLEPTFGVAAHYGDRPLVLEATRSDTGEQRAVALVERQLEADLLASLALWDRLELGLAMPVTLYQAAGQDAALATRELPGMAAGDLRVSARVGVLGAGRRLGPHVALAAVVGLPVGAADSMQSAGGAQLAGRLAADWSWEDQLRLGAHVGVGVGPRQRLLNLEVEDTISWGVGYQHPIVPGALLIMVEIFGALPLGGAQDAALRPAELMGSLRWQMLESHALTLGGGPGLTTGYGTPTWRAALAYTYQLAEQDAPPAPVIADLDGDGVPDRRDGCPEDPEDLDGFEDEDGCPDLDNDRDLRPDHLDECPDEPEDMDGFEDEDGCPDLDNDGDGIVDEEDTCPDEPEDLDGFRDRDGCPDEDNDSDGVPDTDDLCPTEAEVYNGIKDEDGCPDEGKAQARLTRERIEIDERIYFDFDEATIKARSSGLLDQIAGILRSNPHVLLIEIRGHADDRGSEEYNEDLSRRRSESVRAALMERGVSGARMQVQAFGKSEPLVVVPRGTKGRRLKDAREKNRRVEFLIIQQRAPDQPNSSVEK